MGGGILVNTLLIALWFLSAIVCCVMFLFALVKKIRKTGGKKHWQRCLIALSISIVLFILALVTTCNHEYIVTSEVEPTCTEKGYITSVCTICDFERTEYIDELGHDMRITSAIDPTLYFSGEVVRTCAVCGYEEVEEISNEDLIDAEEKLYEEQAEGDVGKQEETEVTEQQVVEEPTSNQNEENHIQVEATSEKPEDAEVMEQQVVEKSDSEQVEENSINIVLDISDYIIDSRPITATELVEQLGNPEYIDNWTWQNNGKSYPIETYGYGDFEFNFYDGVLTRISNPFGADIPYESVNDFIKSFNLENPSGGESSNQYGVYWAYDCGIVRTFRVTYDSSKSVITDMMITFTDIYE